MISLAVMLTMSALVWPALSDRLDRQRMQSTIDVTRQHLLLARAHAQSTGESIEVTTVIDTDGNTVLCAKPFNAGEDAAPIAEPWAWTSLGDAQLLREPPDLNSTASLVDPAPAESIRLAVYLPDGSTLIGERIWIDGSDGGWLTVDAWTGFSTFEVGAGDESTSDDDASDEVDEDDIDLEPVDSRDSDSDDA